MSMSGNEANHNKSGSGSSITPGLTIAQYRIIRHLGTGGMGEVYQALDTTLNRQVALKFLKSDIAADPELRRLFEEEARTLAAINHPNIAVIHEVGLYRNRPFFVMEYIEGETLADIIKEAPMPFDRIINTTEQICGGLEAMHRAEMTHGDIKPSNILIDSNGRVRILDFGLARTTADRDKLSKLMGTIAYISPEQVTGGAATPGSDLFSLGGVLYQMVSGRKPFSGVYDAAVQYSIVNHDPEPVENLRPETPPAVSMVIQKLLKKNPEERIQGAATVIDELKSGEGIEKARSSVGSIWSGSKRRVAALVFLVAVLLTLIVWQWLIPDSASRYESLPKTIAVLSFKNLGSTEDDYFAEGITDAIMTHLITIKDLRVICRKSSMHDENTEYDYKDIGTELGVSYILTGTILWDKSTRPNQVRIHPQLIRAVDEAYLWGQTFDRVQEGIFELQSDIAEQVTAVLKIAVSEADRQKIFAIPTNNLAAYDFFLRGSHYFNRSWDQSDIINATEMFQRAIELDSTFAVAYALLSRGHESMYWEYFDRSEDRCQLAREAADKALSLHPELVEGYLAQGYISYHCNQEYDRALNEFSAALDIWPNHSDLCCALATVQRRQGELAEAVDNFIKSLELDPRSHLKAFDVALTYGLMRQFDQVDNYLDRALAIAPEVPLPYVFKAWCRIFSQADTASARRILEQARGKADLASSKYYWWIARIIEPDSKKVIAASHPGPDSAGFALHLARMYRLLGDEEREYFHSAQAQKLLQSKINVRPDDPRFHSQLGLAYAGLRRRSEALTHASRAVELLPTSRDAFDAIFLVVNRAEVLIIFEEYEAALDRLEHLMSIPGFISGPYLRLDPIWKPLHSHPRFQKIITESEPAF
jgi:serine/threonine protein kinase/tetratricopeptide (TPR) repeat protein